MLVFGKPLEIWSCDHSLPQTLPSKATFPPRTSLFKWRNTLSKDMYLISVNPQPIHPKQGVLCLQSVPTYTEKQFKNKDVFVLKTSPYTWPGNPA